MSFAGALRQSCCVLLAAALALSVRAAPLPAAFTAALAQAGIPLDHVALVVQPLDADTPWLSHNADAALNPASVMKLVTSFAALHQLGPAYAWTTEVWADGVLEDGVLDGDLVVRGNGDPGLTLERIWLLQRELRARGVRHVRGRLVLDSSRFDLPSFDPGAFDGEPLAPYNAAPGALVANFSALRLRLRPQANQVLIEPDLALPAVTLVSALVVDERAPCNGWRGGMKSLMPAADAALLVLSGRYPRSCGEQTVSLSLFPAAAGFDVAFRALWAEAGGRIDGATVAGHAPDAEPLLRFASEPLADALRRLNKHSNNLMARNLYLSLGMEACAAPATLEKSERTVRALLARHGVAAPKLVLENGAGLSRIERISADTLNQLLRAAYRSPLYAEFASALPIAAVDGTLRRRFNGSPASGSAHLKTGTLRDVSALAGYVTSASGERLALVMLVNHERAAHADAAQRVLLEWAWAGGGTAGP